MNASARRIIMDSLRKGKDERGYNDYANDMHDYGMDERRGVKYTGRYGIGGRDYDDRRDYNDNADYRMDNRRDYRDQEDMDYARRGSLRYDYERDMRGDMRDMAHDYAMDGAMRMPMQEMDKWKHSLMNEDGSQGEHFKKEQIKQMADKVGASYKNYDEMDLCMVTNMLYSDYCEALKGVFPPEKELMVYVKMAKAWLEDKDVSAKGAEKLMAYYYCIVKKDDDDHRRGR